MYGPLNHSFKKYKYILSITIKFMNDELVYTFKINS